MSSDDNEAVPGSAFEPAGFWIRAAARMIDWVALWLVGVLLGFLMVIVAVAIQTATGRSTLGVLEMLQKATFIGVIGGVVSTLAYHSMFEGIAGSTIGKRLIGLQVISMDGTGTRFGQGVKRSVAFLVDGLFFGAIGAGEMSDSPEKQRIGDRWANTRVVRRRSLPPEARPPKLLFFAALVSALQAACIITVAAQVLKYLWLVRGV